jgi:hypothetical protein
MALSTYNDLVSAVAAWLNREDLSTRIVDFVVLAEAKFNRTLRTDYMEEVASVNATSEFADLPTDFLELVTVRDTLNRYQALEYISRDDFYDRLQLQLTGTPRYYTLVGRQLRLLPAPTADNPAALEVVYYQAIPTLDPSVTAITTNWLLTRHPDLYLYQSLLAAEPYLMNDERIQVWGAAAAQILSEIQMENERSSKPRGALKARPRTFG